MGFDANQYRAQHAHTPAEGGNLVNIALAGLLALGVLGVVYLYFQNIKQKNAQSNTLHAARMVEAGGVQSERTSEPNMLQNTSGLRSSSASKAKASPDVTTLKLAPKKSASPALIYAAHVDAELVKYRETVSILRSCGVRTEYEYKYYRETNADKYWQLTRIRDDLPKQKVPAGEPIVPGSMTKSWDRLGKIKNEKDVAVFLLKGGAIKHQMAAMEMMSNMSKMDQQHRQDKKQRAALRTKDACMALKRKVQQGKLNVRIPKKSRRS
jgi:hypothetical protein